MPLAIQPTICTEITTLSDQGGSAQPASPIPARHSAFGRFFQAFPVAALGVWLAVMLSACGPGITGQGTRHLTAPARSGMPAWPGRKRSGGRSRAEPYRYRDPGRDQLC